MPVTNQFRHQTYSSQEPTAPWRMLSAEFPPQPGTPEFDQALKKFSQSIADEVDAIWLVHGTFAGNDAFGLFGQLEKLMPASGLLLKDLGKKMTDYLAGDSGNYTPEFAELIDLPIPVRRFVWSGENTHSGRSMAAVELLSELLTHVEQEKRVLLWGHSHAGNIAALITNLLGAESWCRFQFLELVEQLLPTERLKLKTAMSLNTKIDQLGSDLSLDVVNFGTPICYGWDATGYRRLFHVVHHRPIPETNPWQCPVVKAGMNFRDGFKGDWVQVLGITGSNFLPFLFDSTTRAAEQKLGQFLAPELTRSDYWSSVKHGMRVAEEGETLLVDYDNTDSLAGETAGHSIYTKPQWLAFHLELLASLYDSSKPPTNLPSP